MEQLRDKEKGSERGCIVHRTQKDNRHPLSACCYPLPKCNCSTPTLFLAPQGAPRRCGPTSPSSHLGSCSKPGLQPPPSSSLSPPRPSWCQLRFVRLSSSSQDLLCPQHFWILGNTWVVGEGLGCKSAIRLRVPLCGVGSQPGSKELLGGAVDSGDW
jgi:hypothetical protein